MTETEGWYVVKQPEGHCQILVASELEPDTAKPSEQMEQWGPFDSEGEAIARRVGLIRAGKCQPS